jgi:hypothetical protein
MISTSIWTKNAALWSCGRSACSQSSKVARLLDCRGSGGSEMGRLQVPPEVIERVLSHTPSGVTMKHYNLHNYAPEKLAALTRWQDELLRSVG